MEVASARGLGWKCALRASTVRPQPEDMALARFELDDVRGARGPRPASVSAARTEKAASAMGEEKRRPSTLRVSAEGVSFSSDTLQGTRATRSFRKSANSRCSPSSISV